MDSNEQFIVEIIIILAVTFAVFKLFRKHIDPIKRLTTWFVIFFVMIGAVQIGNRYILEAELLPAQWAHLPLQALTTAILILYVPIREEKPDERPASSEDDRGKAPPLNDPTLVPKRNAPKRKFRKK